MKLNFKIALPGEAPEPPAEPEVGERLRDDAVRGNDRGPHGRVNYRAAHASEPPIGAVMKDGTIYAGISPNTGEDLYTTPTDVPSAYSFDGARTCARKLKAHGHSDWRVPTKGELNVLFNNRAYIGGFDRSGANPSGWYWSATQGDDGYTCWDQRFSDGRQVLDYHNLRASLRPVRRVSPRDDNGEPKP